MKQLRFAFVGVTPYALRGIVGPAATPVTVVDPRTFDFNCPDDEAMNMRYSFAERGLTFLGEVVDGVLVPTELPDL